MKINSVLTYALTLLFALSVSAQTNVTFIKGDLNIKYNTRVNPPDTKGIQDDYDINLNVANSVIFHGKMSDRPQIMEGVWTKTVAQPRSLRYDVACDAVNPKNPAQVKKNISKLFGFVNIASSGEYNYSSGLGFNVLDRMAGSDSKFSGVAAGKPLIRPPGWADQIRQTVNINRLVNGKTTTISLNKYDKMEFRDLVLPVGPTPAFPDATVKGEMLYDYSKNTWFFNNVTVTYASASASGENVIKVDRIGGNIRWVEDENRKVNGIGEYQFDIRVNEPVISDAQAFSAAAFDESSFFATDTSAVGLFGTMKYKDTLRNGITIASSVAIDLNGNGITKQQLMVLNKIIIFVSVIPMNAD